MSDQQAYSRRESEVMTVLFTNGKATAREVWTALGETCSYSTIRKLLSILEEKGHVIHETEGTTFVYKPKVAKESAASNAVEKLTNTFFQGSVANLAASLIGQKGNEIPLEELDRIAQLIEQAKANQRENK